MEIILNLIWLSVALVFAGVWVFRWRPVSRACALSGAIALGCALILLFPSISLTDDLHPQIIALDGAGGKRSICQPSAGARCNVSRGSAAWLQMPGHAFVAVLLSLFSPGTVVGRGGSAEAKSLYGQVFRISFSGRSPPALRMR